MRTSRGAARRGTTGRSTATAPTRAATSTTTATGTSRSGRLPGTRRPGRAANWTYAGPASSGFGYSVTHGEYNGDGIDDLVVGESVFFSVVVERVFVFYGPAPR